MIKFNIQWIIQYPMINSTFNDKIQHSMIKFNIQWLIQYSTIKFNIQCAIYIQRRDSMFNDMVINIQRQIQRQS